VAWGATQLARRLAPLAALLELSLLFPDRAPSRFALALRAGSTRQLTQALAGEREPASAARDVVRLLTSIARHDRDTRRHTERVRAYTDLLGEALRLSPAERDRLRWAALLHDLGKVTVDPRVLGKPSRLDEDEWQLVRRHPAAGAELAAGLEPFLGEWFSAIGQHHERWDGSGYPEGLAGEQIGRAARIVAVADSFEVMTTGRSYRAARDAASARAELVACSGTQFDPTVVRALLDVSLSRLERVLGPLAFLGPRPWWARTPSACRPAAGSPSERRRTPWPSRPGWTPEGRHPRRAARPRPPPPPIPDERAPDVGSRHDRRLPRPGRMGVLMAGHVLSAGHDLVVWNRTPGKAHPLVARGAREAETVAEAVRDADRVVLMLFGPDSVREVLPEVVRAAAFDTLVIDGTTIGPEAAREFAALTANAGLRYVDAPVAGSTGPAAEGTLGVLVGGAQADYEDALPLLHLWGAPEKVRRVGQVGAGSALKLCVNQGLGVMAAGVGESLRLGRSLGVDRAALLDVLGMTAYGWYLAQKRPMLEAGDFSGTTFSLDLMAKDLDLAVAAGGDLPVTAACLEAARGALAEHAGEDYAAMTAWLADR
jgi:3-hydroxyisobutyrate dehydrogenase-like beta-hydroxyacid dehydrogenase